MTKERALAKPKINYFLHCSFSSAADASGRACVSAAP